MEAWELVGKNANDCNPVWEKFPVQKDFQTMVLKGTSISVIKYRLD